MSFYTSLSGLRNAETDLRVIAHNIANSETVGFKRSTAHFADLVATGSATDPRRAAGIGATISEVRQNFALGPVEQTGRNLDLAIDGDGFFTLRNPVSGDVTFSRNGSFRMDVSGRLQDAYGNGVQAFPVDAAGVATSNTPGDAILPLTNAAGFPIANVTIDNRGVINAAYADGTVTRVGQVALATFAAPDGLRAIGQTKWQASGDSGPPSFGSPGIGNNGGMISGALERSNVELAEEMVSLLTAQRNFQANARAIDTATQITQTVINLRQ